MHHRAGDGDRLALTAREPADGDAEVRDPDADLVEPLLGESAAARLFRNADRADAEPHGLLTEDDVRDGVEVVAEREILVDGLDAQGLRARGGERCP